MAFYKASDALPVAGCSPIFPRRRKISRVKGQVTSTQKSETVRAAIFINDTFLPAPACSYRLEQKSCWQIDSSPSPPAGQE